MILADEVALAQGLQWPIQTFVADSVSYRDAGFGEWTDFYDWLRAPDGSLLGVRYWLRDDLQFLATMEYEKSYIKAQPGRQIEIYFSGRRDVNQELSCNQEFLYDAIFRSDVGTYAIGFGMEALSETDLVQLDRAGVKWAQVRRET